MKNYCKAYYLKDMRQFSAWKEISAAESAALSDETIVYLWDDLTVVRSPAASEQNVLWEDVTEEWQNFCQTILSFEIPEDLRSISQ